MKPLFMLQGRVQKHLGRGKELGFPTANIALDQKVPEGIYVSEVIIDGKTYQAATFVGAAETFGEIEQKAEAYILDFDQDIYEKEIMIRLYKKLRDNKKFESKEELIEQMENDVLLTREFFRSNFID